MQEFPATLFRLGSCLLAPLISTGNPVIRESAAFSFKTTDNLRTCSDPIRDLNLTRMCMCYVH